MVACSKSVNRNMAKVIIFSAPSGSGKSTIINYLMAQNLNLHFSISATLIAKGEFLEYEEVYKDRFYGTLKSQVDAQLERGENVVCDVDVLGGQNIKAYYGDKALSLFIQPPSIEVLKQRLESRGTDAPEVIKDRLARAEFELSYADKFDKVVVNDNLEDAQSEALSLIKNFLEK